MSLGEWRGRNDTLEGVVLDVLKLDDYIIADYQNAEGQSVNFYVAYYGSQRSGRICAFTALLSPRGRLAYRVSYASGTR